MTPEPAHPSPNYHTTSTGRSLSSRQISCRTQIHLSVVPLPTLSVLTHSISSRMGADVWVHIVCVQMRCRHRIGGKRKHIVNASLCDAEDPVPKFHPSN
ncbi:hypothetical protein TNCV_4116631 [Trichonephila clavipes]|nr:hypothetical protein TNCV_4116631 [Trichonephila clavipes]